MFFEMGDFNFAKTSPDWMNQSFFEKVIRQSEKDPKAEVLGFDISAGSKPGDNFASSVFRASISFKSKYTKNDSKTISVIIKTELVETIPGLQDFAKESPLFRNEIEMYDKVLPEIQSLWLSVDDADTLCPKLIYYSTEPSALIILEDVRSRGFGVIEKTPEDLEVSKHIFRRLAKFHAASFYLHDEQRVDYKNLNVNIFEHPVLVDVMFNQGLHAFIDVAKEWDDFEKFIPSLELFKKEFLTKALKTYKGNSSEVGYNVLNHADLNLKNMLFKKNAEGAIEDFFFIDYQICIHGTPAIDLIYALHFFVTIQNRKQHRHELIAIYHQQFVESLKKFGYLKSPPSLIDLHVELLRNGHLEVLIAICFIVYSFIDITSLTAEDMGKGEAAEKSKRKMYREAAGYKDFILNELSRFKHNGFI